MQFRLPFRRDIPPRGPAVIEVDGHEVPVVFVRRKGARHYILRLDAGGGVRVTLPWYGSRRAALEFVDERRDWIRQARERHEAVHTARTTFGHGSLLLFQGEARLVRVVAGPRERLVVSFADQSFSVPGCRASALKTVVDAHLRRYATQVLPDRVAALAAAHGFEVRAVSIRSQRTRWGSCSATGRISLNWRLVQCPPVVADYVILHELVHLRHLNHSPRFWTEVAQLCPTYQQARTWLRLNLRADGDISW